MSKKIIDEFTHISSGNKRWKLRHPERYKQSERERKKRYVDKDPVRALLKNVKTRAKKKGIEFSITKDDVTIPEVCPVLGIDLITHRKKGWWDNSPSIDRIDNTKGYIPGNVAVISWRTNNLKSNGTLEELERIVSYMRENL